MKLNSETPDVAASSLTVAVTIVPAGAFAIPCVFAVRAGAMSIRIFSTSAKGVTPGPPNGTP